MDLPKIFALYLKTKGVSHVTLKNYLSDLNHFLGWMGLFLRGQNLPFNEQEPRYINQYFNQALVQKYKSYLTSNSFPSSTVNRRLSTLRTLAKFCISQGWIQTDPTREMNNLVKQKAPLRSFGAAQNFDEQPNNGQQNEKIIQEFKSYLEAQTNSANTIKNYLSDIREFLTFVNSVT